MHSTDLLLKMIKSNNGMTTTAKVVNAGFTRGILKYLTDKGELERVARGVYILPEVWEDEFFNLQNQFKRGVFSNETALFLWELTDHTPNHYCMSFPIGYNLTNVKNENIKCTQAVDNFYKLGIIELETPSGNKVKCYNIERTLCDILRTHNKVDIQIISDAFKQYIKRTDKNIPLLSEYAKILRVDKKLRSYLEVLL